MARITRFSIAKEDIESQFETFEKRIFTKRDISRIFYEGRAGWRLPKSMTVDNFIEKMTQKTKLTRVPLPFGNRPLERFIYGDISSYELAMCLTSNAYFSHYTALYLHQLTEQISKTIYVTYEQSKKSFEQNLTQENIDRAFKKPQRLSQNNITYKDNVIFLLNGKFTDLAGVITASYMTEDDIKVTSLERTLIDIVVRPSYSGGIFEILKAYEQARDRKISINKLGAILKRMDFIYPYEQAIGFLLEKAGYRESQINIFKKDFFRYDFYLTYGMKEIEYSNKWRLFYPKGF